MGACVYTHSPSGSSGRGYATRASVSVDSLFSHRVLNRVLHSRDGQFPVTPSAFYEPGFTALHLCPTFYSQKHTHTHTHIVQVLRATLHLKSVAMVTTATPWRQQQEADWEGREGKVALERDADGRYGKGTIGTRECKEHQRMCSGGGGRWREPGGRGGEKQVARSETAESVNVRVKPRADRGTKFQINKKKPEKRLG